MQNQSKLSDDLAADLGATAQHYFLSDRGISEEAVVRAFANALTDARVYWHDAQREGAE